MLSDASLAENIAVAIHNHPGALSFPLHHIPRFLIAIDVLGLFPFTLYHFSFIHKLAYNNQPRVQTK